MPSPLEAHCQRTLDEIVTVSQQIRSSLLAYATGQATSNQNINVAEKLRRQLEIIRTSSDTILEAIAFKDYTINERIMDWLFSGELPLCLEKLKEMNDMFDSNRKGRPALACARPLTKVEDTLTASMTFFDKHRGVFHFLLAPEIWNRESLVYETCQSYVGTLPITSHRANQTVGTTERQCEHGEDEHLPKADQAAVTKRKQELLQQKLDEVSRWLSPLDCTQKHNDTLQLRQEGTCTWLPETELFRSWRTSMPRFLWVHGKAGCGKSVLAASTIEYLQGTPRMQEVVLYFYFDFRHERSTSPTEMMRSLLSQLYRHISDLGVDPGEILTKMLEQKSEGTLSLNDLDKLCDFILRSASCLLYDPLIVIDALDECADINALLRSVTILSQGDIRLLLTSRSDDSIARCFAKFQSLSLESMSEKLSADIALHIRRELDSHVELRCTRQLMKNEVHAKLSERAEGRFRWVQCQLDTLKRCTTSWELKQALDNLPTGLEATYERILEAVDERKLEGKLVQRVLAWLVVALEPLRLAQIVEGFTVDLEQCEISFETTSLGATLLNALSSLATYNEKTDILALSHFSVREFLTSRAPPLMYQTIFHEAHAEVAQMCLRYLSAFLKGPFRGKAAPLVSFPMLSYVFAAGFNHLAHVNPKSTATLEALESLEVHIRHHSSHWDRICQLREDDPRWPYPPWPSLKHDIMCSILIAYAPVRLLQSLLSDHHNFKPRAGTNPLVYAVDLRKTEHATALLACGSDVNMPSLVVDGSHHASPLEIAIDLGLDALVGELLQRGCTVTSEILFTAVCMPWCSSRVLVKVMQTDQFVEFAHEIGDGKLYRSVFSSARPDAGNSKRADADHVALARRLRQIGQDLSADILFGAEVIERAIHAGHISMLEYLLPADQPPPPQFLLAAATGDTSETVSVVRFLLKRGVDINAVSEGSGDSALHLAAMGAWEPRSIELTKMLLGAGCNPHALNTQEETPWIVAAKHRYFSVMKLLTSPAVLLPPDAITLALRHRLTPQVIQSLIHKGADVHFVASDGNTILHFAVIEYTELVCWLLVKTFIEAGCKPTTHNLAGQTVLEVAIMHGYVSVVDLLLSYGVQVPSNILLFALWECSPLRIILSLIHQGADMHGATLDGDTMFHLAIVKYAEPICLDIVKSLIKAGGDPTPCNLMGLTALEAAITRKYASVMEFLLSCKVPFSSDILLFALQKSAPLQIIQSLIHQGADMHCAMYTGETVLHFAVAKYNELTCLAVVKCLIESGCNPVTCKIQACLEAAILRRYTSVVEFLLSHNIPLPFDILLFALQQCSPPQIIQSLIHHGVDIHCTTSDGDTVLHLAIAKYIEVMSLDLVKSFVEAGCDPWLCNSSNQTALEAAIAHGYTSVAEFLYSYNVPLPSNILLLAVQEAHPFQVIQSLIHKGGDVDCMTSNMDTILHLAVQATEYTEATCLDLVKNFIEAGCDPTPRNLTGKTVLEVAITHGYTSVVDFLLSCKVQFPSNILLFALCECSPLQIIQSLICQGADLHCKTYDDDTVLHLVVAKYAEAKCSYLVMDFIKAGCDPTLRNLMGRTVLEAAITRGYDSVVDLLLSLRVQIPSNILLFALWECSPLPIIQSLIRQGADLHCKTPNDDTPLHLAIDRYAWVRRLDLVKTLIEAGCNPTVRNVQGLTARDIAIKRRDIAVQELLLSYETLSPVPRPPGTARIQTPVGDSPSHNTW